MEKVCLVIGAGAGIGGTVAKRFAKEGYHAWYPSFANLLATVPPIPAPAPITKQTFSISNRASMKPILKVLHFSFLQVFYLLRKHFEIQLQQVRFFLQLQEKSNLLKLNLEMFPKQIKHLKK